jgi:hypothetical protein
LIYIYFHHCSGGHFKIFPLYKVNTEGDFLRRRKDEIRMLVHIKEIIKKKNKTDFSQHSCTNVFTAVADIQVQCS